MEIVRIEITDDVTQVLSVPASAQILTLQLQHGLPCIWFLCDKTQPITDRVIRLYTTGETLPDVWGVYIGTFQLKDGSLIYHVFEN